MDGKLAPLNAHTKARCVSAMQKTGNLFSQICDLENLRLAHKHAKRGKGWYKEVKEVEANLDVYLKRLQSDLIEHRYHTSHYVSFKKKEGDKERDIYKLPYYPDRICQWAILQVIEPYLIKNFTKDTYSAIPKRGSQPIINQLRGYWKIKKDKKGKVISKKWISSVLVSDPENTKYCLKMDVRKYYPSLVHDVLKKRYRELFKDEELLWLLDEIIDSISTFPATDENVEILDRLGIPVEVIEYNNSLYFDGIGIPIGNYLSQYSGNFNLSCLDHWLKEEKKVKYLYRYMDDIVIFGSSKEELHKLKREIDVFLAENLKQVLKNNWQVFPTKVRGVDFVGYRFFGEYTLLRKSTCKRLKKKMLEIKEKCENEKPITYNDFCSFYSYKGLLENCDSYRLSMKYITPVEGYMKKFYETEVKGNAEICKCKEYSKRSKAA